MRKRIVLGLLSFIFAFGANAQKISGTVIDEKTKETLPSCNVYWLQGGGGTITNVDGVFEIQKKNDKHTKLVFSYTGYANDTVE
ncbi:MAG: carboxypeptidase-like regulatory domain-containing protein, partial [Bacteroidales bacterium]|nr:carboxypeptidase-like regulatory domain-containing protein [Bacteroidales bacterium]